MLFQVRSSCDCVNFKLMDEWFILYNNYSNISKRTDIVVQFWFLSLHFSPRDKRALYFDSYLLTC